MTLEQENNMKYKSQTKAYRKTYYSGKKVIAVLVSKQEHKTWKHEIGLGPLARLLLRTYFAGKIKLEI